MQSLNLLVEHISSLQLDCTSSQDTEIILWALQPGAPFRLVVHRLWTTTQEAELRIGPS